jgi:hypothetical protein
MVTRYQLKRAGKCCAVSLLLRHFRQPRACDRVVKYEGLDPTDVNTRALGLVEDGFLRPVYTC